MRSYQISNRSFNIAEINKVKPDLMYTYCKFMNC